MPYLIDKTQVNFDTDWYEQVLDQRQGGRRNFSFVNECDLLQLVDSIKAMKKDQENIVFQIPYHLTKAHQKVKHWENIDEIANVVIDQRS